MKKRDLGYIAFSVIGAYFLLLLFFGNFNEYCNEAVVIESGKPLKIVNCELYENTIGGGIFGPSRTGHNTITALINRDDIFFPKSNAFDRYRMEVYPLNDGYFFSNGVIYQYDGEIVTLIDDKTFNGLTYTSKLGFDERGFYFPESSRLYAFTYQTKQKELVFDIAKEFNNTMSRYSHSSVLAKPDGSHYYFSVTNKLGSIKYYDYHIQNKELNLINYSDYNPNNKILRSLVLENKCKRASDYGLEFSSNAKRNVASIVYFWRPSGTKLPSTCK